MERINSDKFTEDDSDAEVARFDAKTHLEFFKDVFSFHDLPFDG